MKVRDLIFPECITNKRSKKTGPGMRDNKGAASEARQERSRMKAGTIISSNESLGLLPMMAA